MSGHVAENTHTFMLMNTIRTYNIRTESPAVLFRSMKKEKKRSRRNGKKKDKFLTAGNSLPFPPSY